MSEHAPFTRRRERAPRTAKAARFCDLDTQYTWRVTPTALKDSEQSVNNSFPNTRYQQGSNRSLQTRRTHEARHVH